MHYFFIILLWNTTKTNFDILNSFGFLKIIIRSDWWNLTSNSSISWFQGFLTFYIHFAGFNQLEKFEKFDFYNLVWKSSVSLKTAENFEKIHLKTRKQEGIKVLKKIIFKTKTKIFERYCFKRTKTFHCAEWMPVEKLHNFACSRSWRSGHAWSYSFHPWLFSQRILQPFNFPNIKVRTTKISNFSTTFKDERFYITIRIFDTKNVRFPLTLRNLFGEFESMSLKTLVGVCKMTSLKCSLVENLLQIQDTSRIHFFLF